MMKDDAYEKLVRFIQAKWTYSFKCPICKDNDWAAADDLLPKFVTLICGNCGNTQLILKETISDWADPKAKVATKDGT